MKLIMSKSPKKLVASTEADIKQDTLEGVLQGFYRNWCASAFAGWGRMRFNQTHNMRTSSPLPEPREVVKDLLIFLAPQLQTIAPKPLSHVGSDLQRQQAAE